MPKPAPVRARNSRRFQPFVDFALGGRWNWGVVLAAFMAVYDAGGVARRVRGEGLILDVTESSLPAKASDPGTQTAKWLIDDDLLVSADLGLI